MLIHAWQKRKVKEGTGGTDKGTQELVYFIAVSSGGNSYSPIGELTHCHKATIMYA
jgi:hypothetical protein